MAVDTPTHPAPLVPAEVDLRGLPWMRLDTGRLLDSDLFALSTGAEFKAAVALWCKSWTQMPAASLPVDDRILAHLSGAGTTWKKLKGMALRGWVQCDDGRLYHPVVAEQALLAWDERVAYREGQAAAAERKRNERAERSQMFESLRAAGHNPKWNATTSELRDLLAQVTDLSRVTGGDESQGREGDVTNQSPAKRGTGEGEGEGLPKASLSLPSAGAQAVEVIDGTTGEILAVAPAAPPPTIANLTASQSGQMVMACKALRKMGAIRFHPGDEGLAALMAEGFTAEQVVRVVGEKALRESGVMTDIDINPEVPELLINGATQQQMGLTDKQHTAVRGAVSKISTAYIAAALRGRRDEAKREKAPARLHRKPTATDNFEGKTYVGTAIDQLSPELRAAVERQQQQGR